MISTNQIIISMMLAFILFYPVIIVCSQADKRKGRGTLALPRWLRIVLFLKQPNPFAWQTVFVQIVLLVFTIIGILLVFTISDHNLRGRIVAIQMFTPIILCIILRVDRR